MTATRPPGAVLWDFDGTLAQREERWSGTLAAVLAELRPGCGITRQDVLPHWQRGFPWHTPEVPHPQLSTPDLWWAALDGVFSDVCARLGLPDDVATEARRGVRQRYLSADGWTVYDDTLPTLQALQERGWRQVVVSNHVPELPELVRDLGLAPYFDVVLTSATVGYEKPHPAMYEAALKAAGVAERVWMVGDNYEADVRGAEAAGIPAILVRKRDARARYCCDNLHAALAILLHPGAATSRHHE